MRVFSMVCGKEDESIEFEMEVVTNSRREQKKQER